MFSVKAYMNSWIGGLHFDFYQCDYLGLAAVLNFFVKSFAKEFNFERRNMIVRLIFLIVHCCPSLPPTQYLDL